MNGLAVRMRDDERGAGYVAAFLVLFSTLFVVGTGLMIDSSRFWTAQRQSSSISLEAARAGANAISAELAYGGGGFSVDSPEAQTKAAAAAGAFVSQAGATLQSVSVNGNEVTVVVSADVDSWFPLMSGRTVTQEASSNIVMGGG